MCQSNNQYDTKPHEADIDKCLVLKRASNAKTRVLTKGVCDLCGKDGSLFK